MQKLTLEMGIMNQEFLKSENNRNMLKEAKGHCL